ncbi:MAG: DUF1501 domain-containing protein [Ilumatobacter sp.]
MTGATLLGADGTPLSRPQRSTAASGATVPETASPSPSMVTSERAAPVEAAGDASARVLVVVEMPGGNDGLSMAVPAADPAYYDLRSDTAIAADEVLDLDGRLGLNPALGRLHARGVGVVEGVGSTVPDGSHFEMQGRWWAGDSSSSSSATGWIGRVADVFARDSSAAGPAAALSVGSGAHPIIASATGSTVSMPHADALWAVAGAAPDDEFASLYQGALRALASGSDPIALAMHDGLAFADTVVDLSVDDESAERLGYDWGLGRSLRFAAAVLTADVGIRVVHVQTQGDYDTHEGHSWKYPELMREIDANLGAFHQDLDERGLSDNVMVMTASEFGRTARENGSSGLDHGTASTMLLSGPGVNGVLGEAPSLTRLDDNDDLIATVPLESYLGGVVESWLGVPADEIFGIGTEALRLT